MKFEYAIIKKDPTEGARIIQLTESFEKLVTHLKMIYPTGVTFIENREERDIRKNTAYPSGREYILLNKPNAVLYRKEDHDNPGFVFSGTITKMNQLCKWKIIKLDIIPDSEETTHKTIEFRNFKLKNYKYGSIALVCNEYTKDINTILATVLSRIDTTSKSNSLVVSKKISSTALENICVAKTYDATQINVCVSKPHKKIIFVDTSVGMTEEQYAHMFSIMKNAKLSNTLVVVAVDCSVDIDKMIHNSDKLMLLGNVNIPSLNTIYNKLQISHLFSTPVLFSSIFKQLTGKFGVMVISRDDDGIVSWYRL
jgi:hypothetical protein